MKKHELRDILSRNMIAEMDDKKVSRKQVAEDLNLNYYKVCDWSRARTYPNQAELSKLASYFNTTIDELTSEVEYEEDDDGITIDTKRQTIRIYDFDNNKIVGRELVSYRDCDPDTTQIMFFVNDDSMTPKFEIGDLVMVKKVIKPKVIIDGDYLLKSEKSTLFVHIYIIEGKQLLVSPLNVKNSKHILPFTIDVLDLFENYKDIYIATRVTKYLD